MGAIALGRIASLAFDGYAQITVVLLAVEIVFVIILVVGALRLRVREGRR